MEAIGLSLIDWLIILIYFGFVLGIGLYLRKFTKSQELTLKNFKSRVVSSIDKKTGVIGLSVQKFGALLINQKGNLGKDTEVLSA